MSDRSLRFGIINDDICDWTILGLIHTQWSVSKGRVLGAWDEIFWADELLFVVHVDAHSINIRCV